MKKTTGFLLALLALAMLLPACGRKQEIWDVKAYEKQSDIISIDEIEMTEEDFFSDGMDVVTYRIRYQSDDCEVVSYLAIPGECLDSQTPYPCIVYNRGGNREYGAVTPQEIAFLAASFDNIVLASQYRGVDGGTGKDEFGGADVHDVLKLIDLCEEFSFVDNKRLSMIGISRGGMMTYEAIREDSRIQKAIVVSGIADAFMSYEERADMQLVYGELVGGSPREMQAEYEKRSATCWADEIHCPVLILHSKGDKKVSYAQAEKMAKCLKEAGKEYKFVTYDDETHGFHQEDLEVIREWLP